MNNKSEKPLVVVLSETFPDSKNNEAFFFEEMLELARFSEIIFLPQNFSEASWKIPDSIVHRPRALTWLPDPILLKFVCKSFIEEANLLFRINSGMDQYQSLILETLQVIKRLSRVNLKALQGRNVVAIYSLWGRTEGLVAKCLSQRLNIQNVCVRHHNQDLYEERSGNYLPFIRNYSKDSTIKKIFLCGRAARYAQDRYLSQPNLVIPLLKSINRKASGRKHILEIPHFLSVSFESKVKRHDLIAAVFKELARIDSSIRWTHIGQSRYLSTASLGRNFRILDSMSHSDFRTHLSSNSYTALVCLSDFEGLPYTMLETLAVGVPSFSTDVGCISSLIEGQCLLESSSAPRELAIQLIAGLQGLSQITKQQIANLESMQSNSVTMLKEALGL